ncbi:MAG: hypothetical protein RDV48_24270 [Candidatus Eremiobacteraeota bacterium]|nr:hypothetical protein [Candidatus Eremiobacteraeota bacterium]
MSEGLLFWLIVILLVMDYALIDEKRHFYADGFFVIAAGLFRGGGSDLPSKSLVDSFIIALFFVTVRMLFRQEFRASSLRALSGPRRLFALSALALVLFLWGSVMVIRPVGTSHVVYAKSSLKKVGDAMEKYAADHKGTYPEKLEQLVPGYFKELPPFTSPLKDGDRLYYEKKYRVLLHYEYTVDNAVPAYTVMCGIDRGCGAKKPGERGYPSYMGYGSKEGLFECY